MDGRKNNGGTGRGQGRKKLGNIRVIISLTPENAQTLKEKGGKRPSKFINNMFSNI